MSSKLFKQVWMERNRFNALFLDFLIRVLRREFGEKCEIVEIDTFVI